jgi:hypothetical protein
MNLKTITICLIITYSFNAYGQLTLFQAKQEVKEYNRLSYSDHRKFEGHKGYAAPFISTLDSGFAFFGGNKVTKSVNLVKMDKDGANEWNLLIKPKFNEIETQSIVQDEHANFYAFMLSYNYSKYRGGAERILYVGKSGNVIWDITLGNYSAVNNPHCSYIHLNKDGVLELRGHIVKELPTGNTNPTSYHWTGWLKNNSKWTQFVDGAIDWKKSKYKTRTGPMDNSTGKD